MQADSVKARPQALALFCQGAGQCPPARCLIRRTEQQFWQQGLLAQPDIVEQCRAIGVLLPSLPDAQKSRSVAKAGVEQPPGRLPGPSPGQAADA